MSVTKSRVGESDRFFDVEESDCRISPAHQIFKLFVVKESKNGYFDQFHKFVMGKPLTFWNIPANSIV